MSAPADPRDAGATVSPWRGTGPEIVIAVASIIVAAVAGYLMASWAGLSVAVTVAAAAAMVMLRFLLPALAPDEAIASKMAWRTAATISRIIVQSSIDRLPGSCCSTVTRTSFGNNRAQVAKTTAGFGKLKLAIGGALTAFAGEKMLAGLTSILMKAQDLSHELTQIKKLGGKSVCPDPSLGTEPVGCSNPASLSPYLIGIVQEK